MSNLPKGWEEVKLGEILNIQTGKKNAQDSKENGEYPFFTRSIDTQKIDTYSFDTEALFIAGEGNFTVKYYKGKFDLHQRTYMLTALKENTVDLKFLQNNIQPKVYQLVATSVGSTVQSLRKPIIEALKIPLPPLEEQKKIANILSTVDKKIAFVEENINATEELKKGLMQKLLTEGIGHTEFKDSELGRIPESWEIKSLSKVCNKVVDKNKDLLYVNVLTNSATLGIISQNEYFDREIVTEKNLVNYFVVNKFDYIYNPRISINAPCGPINQCKKYENGIVSPLYTVFRIEKDSINNDYLEFYFLSNHWNKYIKDNSNTGARHDRMSISDKLFFSMPIFIPPVEEQKQIAEILSTVDKKLENLKNKKLFFEELKKGLMQKLLTGEVRV